MKDNLRTFLDSFDLNTISTDFRGEKVTLRDCIKNELKNVAAKILQKEYEIPHDLSLYIIFDFTSYWKERIRNEEDMVYCDNCGKNVPLKNVVEGVYADNGEHYNYTCKDCNDNWVSRFYK